MADTLSVDVKASLAWLFQDTLSLSTVADASRLDYLGQLGDGAGTDQADQLWHDARTLSAGTNEDLTLSGLAKSIFGSSISVAFAKVKALLIVNAATAVGDDLLVGAAAAQAWSAPFGAGAHQVRVPADACLLLVNKRNGWTVAGGSSDRLRIANVGAGPVSYKIAVVGVRV